MELIFTYANKNRIAKVYSDPISGYTVEYIMNERTVKKTHHIELDLAECLANDYIAEAGDTKTLLNE